MSMGWRRLLLLALMCSWASCGLAQAPAASPGGIPGIGALLAADGTLSPPLGFSGAVNPSGFRMVQAKGQPPRFAPVEATRLVGTPRGCNGDVLALAVAANGNIYLGGDFTYCDDVAASRIARFDPALNQFFSLGEGAANGVSARVQAIAVVGNDVYVGGWFGSAGQIASPNIARWDGSAWHSLDIGVNGPVFALAVSAGSVYAGGMFTQAGGAPASYLARWDGNQWQGVGGGVNSFVHAVAISGSDLLVGGSFTLAGGAPANFIARWNGSNWFPLGSGTDSTVRSIVVAGGSVYAGGYFTQAGGATANHVARWDGAAWSSLGSGSGNGVGSDVSALAVDGASIYAVGGFSTAGGLQAFFAARWNGSAWSSLGAGAANGTNASLEAVVVAGGVAYIGGSMTRAGGASANRIARWNGSAWSTLGAGAGNGVNGEIFALAIAGSDVYVGGDFTEAGGSPAGNIARWNGVSWSALGAGINGNVYAIVTDGATVYAAGSFNNAGGGAASNIARWDGAAWFALGSGINGSVFTLARNGAQLYAGGVFAQAGGAPASNIARWDGAAWSSLGSGVNGTVRALVADAGGVHAGGEFNLAGGSPANRIARWNGSTWSAHGGGLVGGVVYALTLHQGDLYAGGDFDQAGSVSANAIARWNGSEWSAVVDPNQSGLNGRVFGMTSGTAGLLVGGTILGAGDTLANGLALWNGSEWRGLASASPAQYARAVAANGTLRYAGGSGLQQLHQLTLSLLGNGSGSIQSTPASLTCNAGACSGLFAGRSELTLAAVPAPETAFGGWGGACSGTGSCVITPTQDTAVTATFNRIDLAPALTLAPASGATIRYAGTGNASPIRVTPAGGSGQGAAATTTLGACTISGGGAAFPVTTVAALNFQGSGTAPQNLLLPDCVPQAAAVQAVLTCPESAAGGPASNRTWNLSCPAAGSQVCFSGSLAIPDNNVVGVSSTLAGTAGTVVDLDVSLRIDHTYVGDLVVTLRRDPPGGPAGTPVVLIDRPGVPATSGGCPGDHVDALLDDAAGGPVESACAPLPPAILGALSPNAPLAAFNNAGFSGNWVLQVSDRAGGDTGHLLQWCLSPTLLPPQTLTVTRAGSGGGNVTSSPSGIDCGSSCSAPFEHATQVTLSASALPGSNFTGWGGACSGIGGCSVSMTESRSVIATFDLIPVPPTVSYNPAPGGLIVHGQNGATAPIVVVPAGGAGAGPGAITQIGPCSIGGGGAAFPLTSAGPLNFAGATTTPQNLVLPACVPQPAAIDATLSCPEARGGGAPVSRTWLLRCPAVIPVVTLNLNPGDATVPSCDDSGLFLSHTIPVTWASSHAHHCRTFETVVGSSVPITTNWSQISCNPTDGPCPDYPADTRKLRPAESAGRIYIANGHAGRQTDLSLVCYSSTGVPSAPMTRRLTLRNAALPGECPPGTPPYVPAPALSPPVPGADGGYQLEADISNPQGIELRGAMSLQGLYGNATATVVGSNQLEINYFPLPGAPRIIDEAIEVIIDGNAGGLPVGYLFQVDQALFVDGFEGD